MSMLMFNFVKNKESDKLTLSYRKTSFNNRSNLYSFLFMRLLLKNTKTIKTRSEETKDRISVIRVLKRPNKFIWK